MWFDADLLFCDWQPGDSVEVCEQNTETDECLQGGKKWFHVFFVLVKAVQVLKTSLVYFCVLGVLWVDTTRSDQDLWWERARGEFLAHPICKKVCMYIKSQMSGDQSTFFLYSCSCVVLEMWMWTTGEGTQNTRTATAPTTWLSSGFGKWDKFPYLGLIMCSWGRDLYDFYIWWSSLRIFNMLLCCYRRCCWWMQKSESDSYSLWREHRGSRWMALLNSMVRLEGFTLTCTSVLSYRSIWPFFKVF